MLVVKVAGIHLVHATCWLSDVVKHCLAGGCLLVGSEVPTWTFLAPLQELLDLVCLPIIVETDCKSKVLLVNPLHGDVHEWVR